MTNKEKKTCLYNNKELIVNTLKWRHDHFKWFPLYNVSYFLYGCLTKIVITIGLDECDKAAECGGTWSTDTNRQRESKQC